MIRKYLVGIFFVAFWHIFGQAELERIRSFDSVIVINKDASIKVQETVSVVSAGDKIIHGVHRDFPTVYKDKWGTTFKVKFAVEEVLQEGKAVPFRIVPAVNGKRIYIGDPRSVLKPGIHSYTIRYTSQRQIGFFEDHDELYWNVTGNAWQFPIDQATVRVILPREVPTHAISAEAYTGRQGERGRDYTAEVTREAEVIISTTKVLNPGQGLTIVVTWPKGFISQPSLFKRILYFAQDNGLLLWIFTGLLMLLLFCIMALYNIFSLERSETVIPLFKPPRDLSPGAMRFVNTMKFDDRVFASEIVNMAVQQLLSIKYNKNSFKSFYTLIKNQETPEPSEKLYKELDGILFSANNVLDINKKNKTILSRAISYLKDSFEAMLANKYFTFRSDYFAIGMALSAFFTIPVLYFIVRTQETWLFFLILLFVLMNGILYVFLHTYTVQGRKLKAEIEGFKLFLQTTEVERLKLVGSPPTKTPELFEQYLPYAIALGVEKQWSQQFAPLFARLEQERVAYVPLWYQGPYTSFSQFNVATLSAGLTSSLHSAIPAASLKPGARAGSGGRGSSGGGGGGGGGGGW